MLAQDHNLLGSLGSLDCVLEHYSALHRATGMNEERVRQWLSAEPRLQLLLTMVNDGGEVDTDVDFTPFRQSGPLCPTATFIACLPFSCSQNVEGRQRLVTSFMRYSFSNVGANAHWKLLSLGSQTRYS